MCYRSCQIKPLRVYVQVVLFYIMATNQKVKFSTGLPNRIRFQVIEDGDKQISVDISKYRTGTNVTTAGLRLPLQRFVRLVRKNRQVDEWLNDVRNGKRINESVLVGGPVILRVTGPVALIKLREYYIEDNRIKPGNGSVLTSAHWRAIIALVEDGILEREIPGFSALKPCYLDDDHANLLGCLWCSECNFFPDERILDKDAEWHEPE